MKRNFFKSLTVVCSLLLIGAMSSIGFVNHLSNDEIKETRAAGDPYIAFSTHKVIGKAGETSGDVTATLNNYQGNFDDVYVGVVAGGSAIATMGPKEVKSSYSVTFNILFKGPGATEVNVMYVVNNDIIVEDTLPIYSESGGDYTISRFADAGYHYLYFGDKGYLDFKAPTGYTKVTGATTSNQRCSIDSITNVDGTNYKINFTTHDYVPDALYDYEMPGICWLTISSENELDSEQKRETTIYLYIEDYGQYYNALFIAYDFATNANNLCGKSLSYKETYWYGVGSYDFSEHSGGNAAIAILNSVQYEMPDRNTVIKLNDNNIPYTVVLGVSQYDFMVEAYGLSKNPSLNRDTSAARALINNEMMQGSKANETTTILIIITIIGAISLGGITLNILKRRKEK